MWNETMRGIAQLYSRAKKQESYSKAWLSEELPINYFYACIITIWNALFHLASIENYLKLTYTSGVT